MKLIKIYANNSEFKTVIFNENLNIVLGKVTQVYDRDKDTHNLGKSTLVSIIDFLLLKDITSDKNHIFNKHPKKFASYIFFLEIKLNSSKYITIKRSVSKNSRASLKLHAVPYQNFIKSDIWDYEDYSIHSKMPDKNAKIILDKLLNFDILRPYGYRKTINYFLRTQVDYRNVFHLNKFAGKDISWKPFLFELLGFDGSFIYNKYQLEAEYSEQKKLADEIAKKFSVNTDEVDKLKGLIEIREADKAKLEKTINEFDFYLKERGISEELVTNLESEISNVNTRVYNLRYDIEKIAESLKVGNDFDFKETLELYKEVELYFPEELKKSYEELIEFNKQITSERSKYLKESLDRKVKQLDELEIQLKNLNDERKRSLSFLQEKDTFKKFKSYQSELVEIEREIANLKSQIDNIDIIKKIDDKLKELESNIASVTEEIQKQVKQGNEDYRSIRLSFNNLLNDIIHKRGILSISTNGRDNVDFHAEIADFNKEEITSQGEGNTYKKILCVCFDLALLIHYRDRSFYRFVYHDGSLESLDNRKKLNYLELLSFICKEWDIQVIITMIEDDIPTKENGEKYVFSDKIISVVLTDEEGDKGRLFGMSF